MKWIESYQMWLSLYSAGIGSIIIGVHHSSFAWWFLSFWLIFPSLMILSAIYNWIIR